MNDYSTQAVINKHEKEKWTMKFFSKYKYWKHSYKKLLGVLILFSIILLASVPMILLLSKFFPPKDKSAEFILSYAGADPDFGTKAFTSCILDYSGIEYFLDGTACYTDSSGIISISINDQEWHNLTLLWHGELFFFTFNSSISEDIVLATKDIDALAYWNEINMLIVPEVMGDAFELDLLYWTGTSWIVIETITAIESGKYQFYNLVMGLYALSKSGYMDTSIKFTIDQLTITYITNMIVVPDKTIISVEYDDTIFGEMSIDLTALDWQILGSYDGGEWSDISLSTSWWVFYDISDIAYGIITIYEIIDIHNGLTFEYKIVIGNDWNVEYAITINDLIKIGLVAGSLKVIITWDVVGGEPAENITLSLYYFDGSEYIFYKNYLTDFEGKISIIEILPIGSYMIGETLFVITADNLNNVPRNLPALYLDILYESMNLNPQ